MCHAFGGSRPAFINCVLVKFIHIFGIKSIAETAALLITVLLHDLDRINPF